MALQTTLPHPHEVPEQFLTGPAPEPGSGESSPFSRYFAWMLLPFLLLYLAMFPLIMIPQLHFDRWGGLKWVPVLDYPFTVHHQDADVVVFGDSSAFLGIDPRIVDRELHIKAVVLPNTIGSLPVTGELALGSYLAHNRAPRLLVLYFAPWNLDYDHTTDAKFMFEGEETLLRHGSPAAIARFGLAHPLELLAFPFELNSTFGADSLKQTLNTDRARLTAEAFGHISYTDPIAPNHSPCRLPARYLKPTGAATIRSLIARYSSPQTRVVVYLAPIPNCDGAHRVQTSFPGIQPLPPYILPHNWFASDGLYAHATPEHVPRITQLFIDALRASWPVQPSTPTR
jgi:hypothetical protein